MRFSMRLHAAFHSPFVICVAGSQKPMQSLKLFPPPPGVLVACSLGLPPVPGERARLLGLAMPPPDGVVAGC
jgi:hypothetical protein